MELPQPRPLRTEGRKATHDFLSLYSSSPAQQDPTSPQGGHLKTHDFLQPLDRGENNVMKDDNRVSIPTVEKPPAPPSVEHLLPGGIGTYSISYFNQRAFKPEGSLFTAQQASSATRNDENSNCSSYTGAGFTLWDESAAVKMGKTRKENIAAELHVLQEAGVNVVGGQWTSEKPPQPTSNHKHNATTLSSFSSSQPSSSSQRNQSFMDMITSAKNDQEEDDDDDDDEFIIKKEPSPQSKGNMSVKVEVKTMDQKPNTSRSKHSATEQRRRSKINDRFQKLREIIPNSDQKRDKASFLLEVVDYIQFLQEKVNRYENSYSVWNHEPSKMMQLRNCQIADGFIEHARGANTESDPVSLSCKKFHENKGGSPGNPINGQQLVDSNVSIATTFKERYQQPELTSKTALVPSPTQPNIFSFGRTTFAASPVSPNQPSDTDQSQTTTWPPFQFQPNQSCKAVCTDGGIKSKDKELTIESGTINISSAYSQGLLTALTQALQSSGVDLSRASISVKIDLGKRANGIPNSSSSTNKDDDVAAAVPPHSRVASIGEEFGQALKRLRTS